MLNKEDFAKRLQELMVYYEISAAALADKISVQRSSISHLLSGRNNPSLDFIIKILDKYPKVSFEWLVKGNGVLESDAGEQVVNSSTPTLFEQELGAKKREFGEKQPILDSKVANQVSKSVEKILLVYKDGSFKVYDNS